MSKVKWSIVYSIHLFNVTAKTAGKWGPYHFHEFKDGILEMGVGCTFGIFGISIGRSIEPLGDSNG